MLRRTLTGVALLAMLAAPAAAMTVDEIIAKNIEAKGGLEKLRSLKTMKATGKMVMGQGFEAPIVLRARRPNNMRMEFTVQGMTGVQAYDGKTAWMVMPFMGKKDPEPMSGDDAKAVEDQADFDGPLMDYKQKGHTVEFVGKEQVEGAEAYKLKVTKKDGAILHFYLDAETFLDIKQEGKRKVRGTDVDSETYVGDYKEVEGIMVAHSIESGAKGMPQRQKLVLEKIEYNLPMEDSLFVMPVVAAAGADSAKAAAGAKAAEKAAGKPEDAAKKK